MNDLQSKVANHYAEQARLAELTKLQRELADAFAVSWIESNGYDDDAGGWMPPAPDDRNGRKEWKRCVRYLDLRGLIERDGERVRFKDGA